MIELIKFPDLLARLFQDRKGSIRTYFDRSNFVRNLYWNRLKYMVEIIEEFEARSVLDLGCGSGAFLPTLSRIYENVTGIDLDISVAKEIVRKYNCRNIKLYEKNILANSFPDNQFDLIFAASALEHFESLDGLFIELRRILSNGGFLVFSSPTETFFYKMGRKIFKYKKPRDHHNSVFQIRDRASQYFKFYRKRNGPFKIMPGIFSAYVIYAFEKEE